LNQSEQRLQAVILEVDKIVQDVGPKLIKLGHLRSEMKMLLDEVEGGKKDGQEKP
jgi:hypothetical protein